MATSKKILKTCSKGHKFYKSSDCPTCPICEGEKKPKSGFLALISAPARRALEAKGVSTLNQLSAFSEKEILELHGMGPSALVILNKELMSKKLSFKKEKKPIKKTNEEKEFDTKLSDSVSVNEFFKKLKHPLSNVAITLREIILKSDASIGEEIKWNAPAFFYTGKMKPFDPKEFQRHLIVFNFFKKDAIRLIFITGEKVKDKSGLLEGDFKDGRKLAHFYDLIDVKKKEKDLKAVIKKWLSLVGKS